LCRHPTSNIDPTITLNIFTFSIFTARNWASIIHTSNELFLRIPTRNYAILHKTEIILRNHKNNVKIFYLIFLLFLALCCATAHFCKSQTFTDSSAVEWCSWTNITAKIIKSFIFRRCSTDIWLERQTFFFKYKYFSETRLFTHVCSCLRLNSTIRFVNNFKGTSAKIKMNGYLKNNR
jgi:hypothetical protein